MPVLRVIEVDTVAIPAFALDLPEPDPAALALTDVTIPQPQIPTEVRAMLDAAMQAEDEAGVNAIVKYARNGTLRPPTSSCAARPNGATPAPARATNASPRRAHSSCGAAGWRQAASPPRAIRTSPG
ncbi:hypothetical protein AB5I41_26970 [Sphingomonas sp. MMS24-JH45]